VVYNKSRSSQVLCKKLQVTLLCLEVRHFDWVPDCGGPSRRLVTLL
jgi:hypothetical protein